MEKVEQSGKWPQQACTTMFFLIPKNVSSERPIALLLTIIRWWEVSRVKWQHKYRIDSDASDGRNGGAQRIVWEILLEIEKLKTSGRRERSGSSGFGLGLGKGFRTSQSPCGLGLRVLCGYFEHQRCVQFAGCVAKPLQTITALLPRSKWSCFYEKCCKMH